MCSDLNYCVLQLKNDKTLSSEELQKVVSNIQNTMKGKPKSKPDNKSNFDTNNNLYGNISSNNYYNSDNIMDVFESSSNKLNI